MKNKTQNKTLWRADREKIEIQKKVLVVPDEVQEKSPS